MTDVDWDVLRDQYQRGYDTGVAELRAAASRFREPAGLEDDQVRAALADLFAGLADDAETTGPDPRALAVARSLAVLAPHSALRQLAPLRPASGDGSGAAGPGGAAGMGGTPGADGVLGAGGAAGSGGHVVPGPRAASGVVEPVPVVASAVALGRPTRADLVIARVAVAAAALWHRLRGRR